MFEKEIPILSKNQYDRIQKELLSKGYKWIDCCDKYYDLYEIADGFYEIKFVVHENEKTFEWRFL